MQTCSRKSCGVTHQKLPALSATFSTTIRPPSGGLLLLSASTYSQSPQATTRLRTQCLSQKITVAARQMALMKVWAHRPIACGDASPVLEAAEHVLDLVALVVERLVVREGDFPALGRGDAGRDPLGPRGPPGRGGCRSRNPRSGWKPPGGRRGRGGPPCGRSSGAESNRMTGRPWPSQTACSLEFKPPFVRPIWRERAPFG